MSENSMERSAVKTLSGAITARPVYGKISAAAALYIALSIYLYLPYLNHFKKLEYLILINSAIGALGCFFLSRRWLDAFAAQLVAGAVYGFSPFALGFAAYHPLAGLPLAAVPWLFCPAVYYHVGTKNTLREKTIAFVLAAIPFVFTVLFFLLCAKPGSVHLFPMPVQLKLDPAGVGGLISPLALRPQKFILGFYHVPLAVGFLGLLIWFKSGRFKILLVVAPAILLSMIDPIFEVPPVVWALTVMLFGAIVIGLGMEGLALAGKKDSKWILLCILMTCAVAVFTLIRSFELGFIYLQTTRIHAMAIVLMGIIYLLAESNYRAHLFRWSLLCAGIGADLLLGARYLIDVMF